MIQVRYPSLKGDENAAEENGFSKQVSYFPLPHVPGGLELGYAWRVHADVIPAHTHMFREFTCGDSTFWVNRGRPGVRPRPGGNLLFRFFYCLTGQRKVEA